ncbi:putative F-box domain, leucine-rich repeat domain, L domain-containing protein [Medicago truncatula]|uniref:F-box-like protein n=1 Tax=Medicago truncatula TaxID=3880 RepID=A0A072UGX6_MEDTR|nr:F-box-like protein [Medicago truncatula]RHN58542.1 putative F-box domain, leucine-rich repeat domain, L domain-containing protein [Medicago truncatula]
MAATSSKSNIPKNPKKRTRRTMTVATCPYLPDELWEHIFKFLNVYEDALKSLSIVSKQFLSITNRLRFSVTISSHIILSLPHFFQRFPNITSLDLTHLSRDIDLNTLLTLISTLPINVKSLYLSNSTIIPANGLRALSEKMKNLTSLICSKITFISKNDLFFIADCFPLLEELTLMEEYTPHRSIAIFSSSDFVC